MKTEQEKMIPIRGFNQSLPMMLLKAREAAMSRFRPMLRKHNLTEQRWRVIRVIYEHNQIDAGELAEKSFLLSPSLTRILRYLEGEKIVLRSGDIKDQRRSVFRLTSKGKEIINRVAPETESIYSDIERIFGSKEFSKIFNLLEKFSCKVNKQ